MANKQTAQNQMIFTRTVYKPVKQKVMRVKTVSPFYARMMKAQGCKVMGPYATDSRIYIWRILDSQE